jgi:hypothetical protein
VMTVQLMTKKKILTNYQNEALCKTLFFHVIYIMDDIFCNTKYLLLEIIT